MCFYRNLKAFESLKAIKPMVPRWMSPFRSPFREETGGYSHMQVVSCWEHVKRPFVPILSAFLLLGYPILRLKSCQISNVQVHLNMRSCCSCFCSAVPLTKPMPRQDETASETTQAVMHNAGPGASSRSGHKDSAKLLCWWFDGNSDLQTSPNFLLSKLSHFLFWIFRWIFELYHFKP
jgi:hypothetical protein